MGLTVSFVVVSRMFLAAFVLLAFAGSAGAQIQTAGQRDCIVAMNRMAASLGVEQRARVLACVGAVHKGRLAPGESIDTCIQTPSSKLSAVVQKTFAEEAKRCVQVPDFGYSDAADIVDAVVEQELALADELFGADLTISVLPRGVDPVGARCQAAVAKNYRRLAGEQVRAFLDCKTAGLRSGAIRSAADLQNCFGAISEDPRGKIQKAFLKLARDVVSRCGSADIATLFPGECGGAPDYITCVQERVSCRTCVKLNAVDGLDEPCDLMDNGLVDRSCVDPSADECAGENGGHDCDDNATCTDLPLGFACECNEGYTGDGVECRDFDECAGEGDGNNCHADATCTNTPSSFECACNPGFTGDGVTCTNLNECAGEGGGHNCSANASCTDTPGSFFCTCNAGYSGDGVACVDDNECSGEGGGNNCHADAACTNLPGTFSCACNAGFTGNGVVCVDNNECAGEGGGHNCHAEAECTNTHGSFECECNEGYGGDGVSCIDFNECAGEGDGNECDVNASCTNSAGSYSCSCNPGYSGDGFVCRDDNECDGEGSGNNCSEFANCENLPGSFSCSCRDGYYGNPYGGACDPITVEILSPAHGSFSTASSTTVTGKVTAGSLAGLTLKVNNNTVTIQSNGTFSTSVTLIAPIIFNPIRAEVTDTSNGFTVRDRRVVVRGSSVAIGAQVSQSVGLRITDAGFNALEPILVEGVDLDVGEMVPVGTVISDDCPAPAFGTCARALVKSAQSGAFSLDVDSKTNYVFGKVRVNNVRVDLDVWTQVWPFGMEKCDSFYITAAFIDINGNYTLDPASPDPSYIDVNLSGLPTIGTNNFQRHVNCGGTGFQTWMIETFGGDTEQQVRDGLVDFLKDPDGSGPQDAPIAAAIQGALGDVAIAGPIGEGFGVDLQTPLFDVPEDENGVTLASHAIMTPLTIDPGAPTIARTLLVSSTFPTSTLAQAKSPGNFDYGLGIVISTSAFNQILAAQVMAGLLQGEITELPETDTTPAMPITAGALSIVIPEFAQLPADLELRIQIEPTMAPTLTGTQGPNGELSEMVIPHLLVKVVSGPSGSESVWGVIAVDMLTSFDMVIEAGTGNLSPILGTPQVDDLKLTLLDNPLGASEATVAAVLPELLIPIVPSLSSLLGSFPLPEFLGMQPSPVEITRVGTGFFGVYMNVVTVP